MISNNNIFGVAVCFIQNLKKDKTTNKSTIPSISAKE